jgi:hypothetical protein
MESRNIILVFMWSFVMVISIISFWDGKEYIAGGPLGTSLLLFIMAIIVSAFLMMNKK